MSERRLEVFAEDTRTNGDHLSLQTCISGAREVIENYQGLLACSQMPVLLSPVVKINRTSLEKIEKSARNARVIPLKRGEKWNFYYYDNEGVLVLTALSWFIREEFVKKQSFNMPWKDIVRNTRTILGEDHPLNNFMKQPQRRDLNFSIDGIKLGQFLQGRSRRNDRLEKPTRVSTEEQFDAVKDWNKARVDEAARSLHPTLNSYNLRLSDIPKNIAQMVEYIRMANHIALHGRKNRYREFDDSLSDLTERDLRLGLMVCSGYMEENPRISDIGQLYKEIARIIYIPPVDRGAEV